MAVTDYASIRTELNNFTERSYSEAQVDTFIGLWEGDLNLHLGPNYERETSATVSFTSGSASQPSGFLRPISLVHTTYGKLTGKPIGVVRERRILDTSGIPDIFAITGTTIELAPTYTGDLTLDYAAKLTGLSSGNTSNWLLAAAPQAYFWGVCAQAKAFEEEWPLAAALEARAKAIVDELSTQATVAQYGRSSVTIAGATP
jgi:hypothetical protein